MGNDSVSIGSSEFTAPGSDWEEGPADEDKEEEDEEEEVEAVAAAVVVACVSLVDCNASILAPC